MREVALAGDGTGGGEGIWGGENIWGEKASPEREEE